MIEHTTNSIKKITEVLQGISMVISGPIAKICQGTTRISTPMED